MIFKVHAALLLLSIAVFLSIPSFSQDCSDGDMTIPELTDTWQDALDRLRDASFPEGGTAPNSGAYFDSTFKKKILIGPHKSDFIAGVLVEDGRLGKLLINMYGLWGTPAEWEGNAIEGIDECLKKCPGALGEVLDILLKHELNNTPSADGGGGMPDDPKGDAPTPIQEVANTYDSMKGACEAAGDADENGMGEEKECTIKAMCALIEHLEETMKEGNPEHAGGDGVPGSPSETNKPGYADEIKANGGAEVPGFPGSSDLPSAGINSEGECEIEIEPCSPCEDNAGSEDDAGTEGDGAAGGSGDPGATGGTGGG